MSTILIADEDLLIHILIRMALDDASDTSFLEATHTGEAAKLAREHQSSIDLLLCDMELPGEQDATEFVALFSAMHPAAKILMMSSQDIPALPKNPGWHYILKPFRAAEVRRKIELVLGAPPIAVGAEQSPATSSARAGELSAETFLAVNPDMRKEPSQ
jgi:DNA-binding NarL/FixJ family response regulator